MNSINAIAQKMNLTSNNLALISDNLANFNTPNFKRKYIDVQGEDFSNRLSSRLKQTNSKHISGARNGEPNVKEVDAFIKTDKNGVDVDTEVLELSKNKMFHSSLVRLLNNDVNNRKMIITSK